MTTQAFNRRLLLAWTCAISIGTAFPAYADFKNADPDFSVKALVFGSDEEDLQTACDLKAITVSNSMWAIIKLANRKESDLARRWRDIISERVTAPADSADRREALLDGLLAKRQDYNNLALALNSLSARLEPTLEDIMPANAGKQEATYDAFRLKASCVVMVTPDTDFDIHDPQGLPER